jgi:protoheme IX farnesyltransferase
MDLQIEGEMQTTSAQTPNLVSITRASWRDYLELMQPRLAAVFLLPMLVAFLVAADSTPSLPNFLLVLCGGFLAAGGAAALNGYYDRDLDAKMSRTRSRPLPAGRLEPENARRFGLAISGISFLILWIAANILAAALALAGILIHVIVYTRWLKRRSIHNVLVGGLSGALAPLVGWAAATGTLPVHALLMAAIVFYWNPPYHWSLTLMRLNDYSRAGVPMLPVIKGSLKARKQMAIYSVMMFVLALLPAAFGMTGFLYAEAALLFGGIFILQNLQLIRQPSVQAFTRVHKYSIAYLALLFTAMLVDKLIVF